jgi:hypothetical protein
MKAPGAGGESIGRVSLVRVPLPELPPRPLAAHLALELLLPAGSSLRFGRSEDCDVLVGRRKAPQAELSLAPDGASLCLSSSAVYPFGLCVIVTRPEQGLRLMLALMPGDKLNLLPDLDTICFTEHAKMVSCFQVLITGDHGHLRAAQGVAASLNPEERVSRFENSAAGRCKAAEDDVGPENESARQLDDAARRKSERSRRHRRY